MNIYEKVKLLFVARKPVTEVINQVKGIKAGYRTLGFWITLVGSLVSLAGATSGFLPVTTALIITTALTAGYNILRSLQNADAPGTQPVFQSTRFWIGILGIVSNAIASLQAGGINPEWIISANGIIAAIMAGAQSVGAEQPATK